MKKITVLASIFATLMLFGCAKPVTEVKAGASVLNIPEQHQSTKNAKNAENAEHILADVMAIQEIGQVQQTQAAQLQQRMEQALQKQNVAEMAKLATEFKTFIDQSNQRLQALNLKTEDGKNLRDAVVHNSVVGLEVSQVILTTPQKDIKPETMQALQEKAMAAQSELMAISEVIRIKVQGNQPAAIPPQGMDDGHGHHNLANSEDAAH